MIEELIARVFAARNAAHIEHWRTKSYSQHMALGAFYDDVIEALDAVVESYQGVFSLVDVGQLQKQEQPKSIIAMLEDDLEFIGKNRKQITKGLPAIDNLLQTVESVYMSTLYKLKRLA